VRATAVLTGIQGEHVGGVDGGDVGVGNGPAGHTRRGHFVFMVSVWCSVCRDFSDGGAGC
jgi:hypothetical protein